MVNLHLRLISYSTVPTITPFLCPCLAVPGKRKEGSQQGSVIMGPGGQMIRIGGSVTSQSNAELPQPNMDENEHGESKGTLHHQQ